MKKVLLTSILLASVCIVLGGMNAFQKMVPSNYVSKSNASFSGETENIVKYPDCITEEDFPSGYLLYTHEITNQHSDWDIVKVNSSVKKYSSSLDSTVKNLSTVDAHDFLHQAFEKAKAAVDDDNAS
ncbi:MAG: hypothetical protein VX772_00860, partial [Bacteroidota bacterium]|nr:hypothetical protein [Bacteroidota bacterium]